LDYTETLGQTLLSNGVTYCVFGREVGENGTRHLQGYLELSSRLRINQVKNLLGTQRVHLEMRRGTATQASEYCKKDGDFEEFGELSQNGQGHRSDLDLLQQSLIQGQSLSYISQEHFSSFIKYQRGIQAFRNIHDLKRTWICSVIVYWGRTGTGKTHSVIDNLHDINDIYIHPGGQWFDGYDGHKIVLFDDYGGSEFKLTYLLKLLDKYPMRVPIKGGFVSWVPHEIYITSNKEPSTWYQNAYQEHINAMFRRITNIVHFE